MSRPPETFLTQPVRSLQTMLRVISEDDGRLPSLIPDGIYGNQTMSAVSAFQRRVGLPVTGVTDLATWDAIYAAYEPALTRVVPPEPLCVLLDPCQVIGKEQCAPTIYIVQAMLQVLSEHYTGIPAPTHSGTLDPVTSDSLSHFQCMSGLEKTGELDKVTWKHLVLQYVLCTACLCKS